ncbi:hypothetical protein HHO41_02760 [Bacillus sp. DNRA2]|uniref:hypothetical protein n=1 Tax=Bacillus sp. DNRA2 TaxID=2723053 RepID=UPI00145D2385|nr:hypothetical protein [Bacillus sp. DNRA2]NMD69195.1 hypothetical protein [Bacillus sp. DNRA2]
MNEIDKLEEQTFRYFKTKILILLLLLAGLIVAIHFYLKSQIKIEAPEIDLGRKVVVKLPEGRELQTFENLLIEDNGKLYYEGEFNTIDISDGVVVIQDWN